MNSSKPSLIVLGGGPAGLGLALQTARRGFPVAVVERGQAVGGNAASFSLAGQRVDYGSHRLHPACAPGVLSDIREMLGEDLLTRPRHGRIHLMGRWIGFPLRPSAVFQLPLRFGSGVARDALAKPFRKRQGQTFADVLRAGLGATICEQFYFPYARKIWGLAPEDLSAEQARRRVSAGSFAKLARKVLQSVPGLKSKTAGIFYYPRMGFGQICDAYRGAAEKAGSEIHCGTAVESVELREDHVAVRFGDHERRARHVFSTIPITALAQLMRPAAPEEILLASQRLKYRAMILIYLVLDASQFTEYDAHYFPGGDVRLTRLSEPKNYSLRGVEGKTVLCGELPCDPSDAVWEASPQDLAQLVREDLECVGLPIRHAILEVHARKLPQAYPIYTPDYAEAFTKIDQWLDSLPRLTTLGRQGLFAHDNTHHALAMAYAAADCLSDQGEFDTRSWARHRDAFRDHIVED